MLASPSIESRFETEELRPPVKKKEAAKPRRPLHLCALAFLELVLQFIKCLFCVLIQMAADFQFHFGNLRIGLPLRVPDPIFRCADDIGINPRQMQ